MLPVFPVFHTKVSVRWSINSKRNKDIQSRDEMSKLGKRAPKLSLYYKVNATSYYWIFSLPLNCLQWLILDITNEYWARRIQLVLGLSTQKWRAEIHEWFVVKAMAGLAQKSVFLA